MREVRTYTILSSIVYCFVKNKDTKKMKLEVKVNIDYQGWITTRVKTGTEALEIIRKAGKSSEQIILVTIQKIKR